jgi:hypothetical protein
MDKCVVQLLSKRRTQQGSKRRHVALAKGCGASRHRIPTEYPPKGCSSLNVRALAEAMAARRPDPSLTPKLPR